nr:serine/threonine-protein kinase EDR1 [Ipomoea batatas]
MTPASSSSEMSPSSSAALPNVGESNSALDLDTSFNYFEEEFLVQLALAINYLRTHLIALVKRYFSTHTVQRSHMDATWEFYVSQANLRNQESCARNKEQGMAHLIQIDHYGHIIQIEIRHNQFVDAYRWYSSGTSSKLRYAIITILILIGGTLPDTYLVGTSATDFRDEALQLGDEVGDLVVGDPGTFRLSGT